MSEENKKELQSRLWDIANTLRGKMGADEFRDYILGFIFYKYLSERMQLFADEILKHDGVRFEAIDDSTTAGKEMLTAIEEAFVGRLGYFPKPSELFHKLAEKGGQKTSNFILEDLTAILKHIEGSTMGHDSEEDFEGLFKDLDLGSSMQGKSENQKNELIAKVLVHLDQIDFRLQDTEADVLGDAYEYLIGQLASGVRKKAGEFYTPKYVVNLIAKIFEPYKRKIYDPSRGSGGMFVQSLKFVESHRGNTKDISVYGQEFTATTYSLTKTNVAGRGLSANFGEVPADTVFKDHPPVLKGCRAADKLVHDGRWNGYDTPPSGSANYAWILHKFSEHGVAGFALANGSMSTNTKGEVEILTIDCSAHSIVNSANQCQAA